MQRTASLSFPHSFRRSLTCALPILGASPSSPSPCAPLQTRREVHQTSERPATSSPSSSPPPLFPAFSQDTLREDEAYGVFQNTHIKHFPVRAAIDIGTGGVVSLCIGRVDARAGAVTKLMYSTQLPLYLEATSTSPQPHGGQGFALSEQTMTDIKNKMRILAGAMRRDAYEGLSERAAVLSHPLCLAENALALAEELTREFKINVRVLGKTFHAEWPGTHMIQEGQETSETGDAVEGHGEHADSVMRGSTCDVDVSASEPLSIAEKLRQAQQAKGKGRHKKKKGALKRLLRQADKDSPHNDVKEASSPSSATSRGVSTEDQLQQLAFLAHAASAQCVAPHRMLVLVEDAQKGVSLVGTDTTAAQEVQDLLVGADGTPVDGDEQARILKAAGLLDEAHISSSSSSSPSSPSSSAGRGTQHGDPVPLGLRHAASMSAASSHPLVPTEADPNAFHGGGLRLVEHRLPIDAAEAHRRCILHVQKRPAESYHLHASSPNPLLREEWASLRDGMTAQLQATLPAWVRRKAALGGVVAATSFNGGIMNLAARVAQRAPVSLEHLEVNAQFHFCGLTDILLAANFPNPLLVLPSTALAAAIMRAVETPRVSYLPELSVAAALLVQPSLWTYRADPAEAHRLRRALRQDAFYEDVKQRTFSRPHVKSNPTAPPDAEWSKNASWNDLSFERSMRGT